MREEVADFADMNFNEELTLVRDTTATVIPAGEEQVLVAGTRAIISQALGEAWSLRTVALSSTMLLDIRSI